MRRWAELAREILGSPAPARDADGRAIPVADRLRRVLHGWADMALKLEELEAENAALREQLAGDEWVSTDPLDYLELPDEDAA